MEAPQENEGKMESHLRAFIIGRKYDELFSQGGCFHFAKCAFDKGLGELHCTRSSYIPTKIDHVFVISADGRVFDRRGFRPKAALLEERQAINGDRPTSELEINQHIASMKVSEELHRTMFCLADELISKLSGPPHV
jgi:hypothetical protein